MIYIYRSSYGGHVYDPEINVFHRREHIDPIEVIVKTKTVFGKSYTYAEPATPGRYAFGGTILHTSNGIHPQFSGVPIKLHDRNMDLES